MSYTIIDSKTEKKTFLLVEHVTTKLSLVYTGQHKFGIIYDATYSGPAKGHVSGGPEIITGNESVVVHKDPQVDVTVSGFNDTGSHISMKVKIIVHKSGSHTIFDQTLSGAYSRSVAWAELAAVITESEAEMV